MAGNSAQRTRPTRSSVRLNVLSLEDRSLPATLLPGFGESTVASGLTAPTTMDISPDGKLFIAEQAGTMQVWQNGERLQENFFRDAPLITQVFIERGLLGLTFDPNYAENRFVYVYYTTTADDNHNRVSRFTANAAGDLALPDSETVIVDLDPHPSASHLGGAMQFGPDGKLYVAVGNAVQNEFSQSLTTRHGKILRYNRDGSIPDDNPTSFAGVDGTTTGEYRAIWAIGLRNPYSFAIQPGTGLMLINDVGEYTYEEIDVGGAGLNYGWPDTEGYFDQSQFPNLAQPIYAYPRDIGQCIAGAAFYNPAVIQFPADYAGDYFFADFGAGWIKRMNVSTRVVSDFASDIVTPVNVRVAADGSLYYLSYAEGTVNRVYSAPRVTGTAINDGSAQRSLVKSIAISFNSQVNFVGPTSQAFSLNRVGGGTVGFILTPYLLNGVTVVTLTNFTGSETEAAGSLRDGRYVLRGMADLITYGSLTLDGNGDGMPTLGDDFVFDDAQGLFRLFGDVNGDRRVNIADYGIFSLSYQNPQNYNPALDFDGNGSINIFDYGQFALRYLTMLP